MSSRVPFRGNVGSRYAVLTVWRVYPLRLYSEERAWETRGRFIGNTPHTCDLAVLRNVNFNIPAIFTHRAGRQPPRGSLPAPLTLNENENETPPPPFDGRERPVLNSVVWLIAFLELPHHNNLHSVGSTAFLTLRRRMPQ